MIKAEKIHKQYGELEVLKGVDLHIKKSEIVAIVGPSGAGKTTLLQILGTLDKPTSSALLAIDGEDITKLKDRALSKLEIHTLVLFFNFTNYYPNSLLWKMFVSRHILQIDQNIS